MPTDPESTNLLRALFDLQRQQDARRQETASASLDPQLAVLRAFQSARLRRTYGDFLDDQNSRQVCEFFLSDIYGVKDFSQRDLDFQRLYELLSRYLPASMLRALKDSLELNLMSHALDTQLLDVMVNQLGMRDQVTAEMYSQGYRICDNYAERKHQIAHMVALVLEVGQVARLPLVGVTLRLARVPAERAGWDELYDFLWRGYRAFQPMKSVRPFAMAIQDREMAVLENLMGGKPAPFDLL